MTVQKRSCSSLSIVILVALCMLLGACSTRNQGKNSVGFVAAQNDGPPLTKTELEVLHTSGRIDRNIPSAEMQNVETEYRHFLRSKRKVMERFSQRAAPYLPWAQKVFRENGMPEDLAFLAIIESGYRADITSKAGAAGAWQFMSFTGKKFELEQDGWNDERLDPYEATEAAAKYLKYLYGLFNDWPTAIAAYNAGEGKIKRAKEGLGARNFYEIKMRNDRLSEKTRLKPETLTYVPRFIAVTKIMRNLDRLDFPQVRPELSPEVLRYTVKSNTDLKGMARAVNMPWSEFAKYNRHHKKGTTCPHHETYVYIPAESHALAIAFLNSPAATVKDSAQKTTAVRVAQAKSSQMREKATARPGRRTTYTVQDRDSLWIIARKYNVSVDDLKRWNNVDEKKLSVGKVLVVSEK